MQLENKVIEGRFTEWFDEKGWLHPKALRRWLATNIEAIGEADPQEEKVEAAGTSTATEFATPYSAAGTSDGAKSTRRGKKRG